MNEKIICGDMVVLLPHTITFYNDRDETLYLFPDKMNLGDPESCVWDGTPALVLEVIYRDRMFPRAYIFTSSGIGWTYEDYLEKLW